jgi:hypothetical protein
MAGSLTISTLKDSSGVLATQNGMTGIAKAWVEFNGVTTVTIRGSFNVSSVTRTATGFYTIAFTTATPDANYAVVASTSPAYGVAPLFVLTNLNSSGELANTTSSFGICTQSTASAQDSKYCNVAVLGN